MTSPIFPLEHALLLERVRALFPDFRTLGNHPVDAWFEATAYHEQASAASRLMAKLACVRKDDYASLREAAELSAGIALACGKRALAAAFKVTKDAACIAPEDMKAQDVVPPKAHSPTSAAFTLFRAAQGFQYLSRCAAAQCEGDA